MNYFHPRPGWAELARYAEACVDLELTPQQELQRLSILLAMVQEITVGLENEADVKEAQLALEEAKQQGTIPLSQLIAEHAADEKRNLGEELLEGVREIKAGGGKRHQVEGMKE